MARSREHWTVYQNCTFRLVPRGRCPLCLCTTGIRIVLFCQESIGPLLVMTFISHFIAVTNGKCSERWMVRQECTLCTVCTVC